MKPNKPKPFKPGLVRGQLNLRTPLRVACQVEIIHGHISLGHSVLEYPSHAETPNELSRRQLAKGRPKAKRINPLVNPFDPPITGEVW